MDFDFWTDGFDGNGDQWILLELMDLLQICSKSSVFRWPSRSDIG